MTLKFLYCTERTFMFACYDTISCFWFVYMPLVDIVLLFQLNPTSLFAHDPKTLFSGLFVDLFGVHKGSDGSFHSHSNEHP